MAEQEFLDTLRSIQGHLTVLEKWANDCTANVKAGTLKNLELIKETNKRLAETVEALRT